MTPAERLRKHQRALEKTQRELDRERVKLENQEKKLVQDIKKSAKNGQIGACKIQAKDLVRTRRYVGRIVCYVTWTEGWRAHLRHCSSFNCHGPLAELGIDTFKSSIRCAPSCRQSRCAYRCDRGRYYTVWPYEAELWRLQTVRSNEQMMQSMKGATSLLGSMNRSMNLPALQRIAMEFEKENDIMDQRQEMVDDAIDDVTGLEDEEEGEEVVKEVLDEIGIDLGEAVCVSHAIPASSPS